MSAYDPKQTFLEVRFITVAKSLRPYFSMKSTMAAVVRLGCSSLRRSNGHGKTDHRR
jgi:hypothetical protein